MPGKQMQRLEVDGKFFRSGGERVFLKMVTYGPFPEPRPDVLADDREQMRMIAAAGFNAVRIYGVPDRELLDVARDAGLWVFAGLAWEYWCDFISKPALYSKAQLDLTDGLKNWGDHDALAGVFVANEIPADMVRWMGVRKVCHALEDLIASGKSCRPELLFAYANFPTTEFLEPANADFTAMNIYLEQREDFAGYLPRLHNVAGDRPVLLTEFGLDTRSHGESAQSEAMAWAVQESLLAGMAGLTVYAWSDHWLNRGVLMEDWAFGLNDREGNPKPALRELAGVLPEKKTPEAALQMADWPMFSVVVCTHNGGSRMHACLSSLQALDYPSYEVIVVDDGSTDDTAEVVAGFDNVQLIRIE
ncbi:MAG: glycosyltransferase family 2 protein, partial [Verrucomicrobiae bacterium]|nr:glycosyltransferase family 2 protein [Verrucomicrobiae bacterium]NNJ86301.1 glycosyltransferase family 2 protein [Akkermansiaceae bacterium]